MVIFSSKFLPIIAMVAGTGLAIATSAFKAQPVNKSGAGIFTFEYVAPDPSHLDYSKASVETLSNWHISSGAQDCNGSDKACEIVVSDASVDNPSNPQALNSAVNLQLGGTSTEANVIGTADFDVDPVTYPISNRN